MDPLLIVSLTPRRPVSAPRSRPWSARTAQPHVKFDPLAEQVLLNSRVLTRTHHTILNCCRPPQPVRPSAPLDMLAMPSPDDAAKTFDFHDSKECQAAEVPSFNIVLRKRQLPGTARLQFAREQEAQMGKDMCERQDSGTPERMTTLNSSVLQEYQTLLKQEILQPAVHCTTYAMPLAIQKRELPSDKGKRQRLTSAHRPAGSHRPKCDRSSSFHRYKFAKRELSASFAASKQQSVFDPYEIYSVSNGTIRVT